MPRISDPLELLTQQHDEIIGLLDALASPNDAERDRAFVELAELLPDHLAAEQELLYPVVGCNVAAQVHEELVAEHLEIKRALADLLWFGLEDADTASRIASLRALVEGHTAYQEQELFETAAEQLAPIDITVLGSRLHAWFVSSIAQAA
jgi:Hemerythrin HHE cation binding domain